MKYKRQVKTLIANPYGMPKERNLAQSHLDRQGRVWTNNLLMSDSTSQRAR